MSAAPFKGQEPGTQPDIPPHPKYGKAQEVYTYRTWEGEPLYYVCRFATPPKREGDPPGKTFLQGHRKASKWVWNIKGIEPVLYRLPELAAYFKKQRGPLYICEGEKDVHACLAALKRESKPGEATTNPMGAGKWDERYSEELLNGLLHAVVVVDNDEIGIEHGRQLVESLSRYGTEVELVRGAVHEPKSDLADHLAAGHTLDQLVPVPEYRAGEGPVFMDAYEFVRQQEEQPPPLWGTEDVNLLPLGGLMIVAGPPSSGKTTFILDMACHLASGMAWPPADKENERAPTPWPVHRPLRVAIIENEGPREAFRGKLATKLRVFPENIVSRGGAMHVQVWRWGAFSFADPDAFGRAAQEFDELEVDLVIGDPLTMLGVEGVGSPADTREFVMRLRALGLGTHRAFLLIHHFAQRAERTDDEIARLSGSWGGHLDTLLTLQPDSQEDRARLAYAKVRWATGATPKPVVLGRVYATKSFEAIAEEHDTALVVPELVAALKRLREQGGGYKGWCTVNNLADNHAHKGRKIVGHALKDAPHLFAMLTGEAAKELGAKNKTTKLWGLAEWPEAPAEQEQLGAQVVPLRPPAEPQPDPDGDIPW